MKKLKTLFGTFLILGLLLAGCTTSNNSSGITAINLYSEPGNYINSPKTSLAVGHTATVALDITPGTKESEYKSRIEVVFENGQNNMSCDKWYKSGYFVGYIFTALHAGSTSVYFVEPSSNVKSERLTFNIAKADVVLSYDSLNLSNGENNIGQTEYYSLDGIHHYDYLYRHLYGNSSNKTFYFEANSYLSAAVFSNMKKFTKVKIVLNNPCPNDNVKFMLCYDTGWGTEYDVIKYPSITFNSGETEKEILYNYRLCYILCDNSNVLVSKVLMNSDID